MLRNGSYVKKKKYGHIHTHMYVVCLWGFHPGCTFIGIFRERGIFCVKFGSTLLGGCKFAKYMDKPEDTSQIK